MPPHNKIQRDGGDGHVCDRAAGSSRIAEHRGDAGVESSGMNSLFTFIEKPYFVLFENCEGQINT